MRSKKAVNKLGIETNKFFDEFQGEINVHFGKVFKRVRNLKQSLSIESYEKNYTRS